MRKITLLFLVTLFTTTGWGQVPCEMQYSLMVLDPTSGQVLTGRDVALTLELRQGSATSAAVWSQGFNVKTDQSGFCQLTLSMPDTIDWGKGNYYMALLVDGKEAGAPKLTAVPYALCAASLEGIITKEELIGTWMGNYGTLTFNANGRGYDSYYESSFEWKLNNAGCLALIYENDDTYPRALPIFRLSNKKILVGNKGESIWTKQ